MSFMHAPTTPDFPPLPSGLGGEGREKQGGNGIEATFLPKLTSENVDSVPHFIFERGISSPLTTLVNGLTEGVYTGTSFEY